MNKAFFVALIVAIICFSFSSAYIVKSGDSLSGIAARFPPCTVAKLVSINKIANANLIYVGQNINTNCGSSPSPTPSPTPSPSPSGWRTPNGPHSVFWRQCDPAFGSVPIGTSNVCQIGCLLTSLAVAHRNAGISLPGVGTNFNPGHFANYFTRNGGFSGNLLVHGVVSRISGNSSYLGQSALNWAQVNSHLTQGNTLIANVNNGGHWVVVYGVNDADKSTVLARDSGVGRTSFRMNEIVRFAIYRLRR